MLDVVEALEGPIAPMECFHAEREGRVLCSHEADGDHACATKLLWTRVQGGVTKALDRRPRSPTWSSSPARRRRGTGRRASRLSQTEQLTTHDSETMADLEIRNLHVNAEDKQILKGLDLEVSARRGPRADGPERLRQVDARERDHGPPGARGDRGRDRLRRRGHHRGRRPRSARAPASSWPSSTRSRSPASPSPSTCGWRSTPTARRAASRRSASRSSAATPRRRWSWSNIPQRVLEPLPQRRLLRR